MTLQRASGSEVSPHCLFKAAFVDSSNSTRFRAFRVAFSLAVSCWSGVITFNALSWRWITERSRTWEFAIFEICQSDVWTKKERMQVSKEGRDGDDVKVQYGVLDINDEGLSRKQIKFVILVFRIPLTKE